MTEKEKMLSGQWHDANFDQNLLEERRKAELLCYDFNMSRPGSEEQISALKIYTDALDCELINLIEKKCLNMTLEKTQIEHHFSELADFIGTQNKHSFYSCDLQTILSDIKTSLLYF